MVTRNQASAVAEVRRSRPYHVLIAVGLVSYGLLHLVLAWIAIQIVLGRRGDASSEGELTQLRKQQLTVITGTPGSGKSVWADALVMNLAQSSWEWKFANCKDCLAKNKKKEDGS